MNICRLLQQLIVFSVLCITSISIAQSKNFDHLKDGQEAFNSGLYQKAFDIWHNLALTGDADAQMFVGLAYRNGWGVPKDSQQAIIWYKLSAEQQNTAAQFLLGLSLLTSNNSEEVEMGIKWLHTAAKNGDPEAHKFLQKAKQKSWFAVSDKLASYKQNIPAQVASSAKTSPASSKKSDASPNEASPQTTRASGQVVLN